MEKLNKLNRIFHAIHGLAGLYNFRDHSMTQKCQLYFLMEILPDGSKQFHKCHKSHIQKKNVCNHPKFNIPTSDNIMVMVHTHFGPDATVIPTGHDLRKLIQDQPNVQTLVHVIMTHSKFSFYYFTHQGLAYIREGKVPHFLHLKLQVGNQHNNAMGIHKVFHQYGIEFYIFQFFEQIPKQIVNKIKNKDPLFLEDYLNILLVFVKIRKAYLLEKYDIRFKNNREVIREIKQYASKKNLRYISNEDHVLFYDPERIENPILGDLNFVAAEYLEYQCAGQEDFSNPQIDRFSIEYIETTHNIQVFAEVCNPTLTNLDKIKDKSQTILHEMNQCFNPYFFFDVVIRDLHSNLDLFDNYNDKNYVITNWDRYEAFLNNFFPHNQSNLLDKRPLEWNDLYWRTFLYFMQNYNKFDNMYPQFGTQYFEPFQKTLLAIEKKLLGKPLSTQDERLLLNQTQLFTDIQHENETIWLPPA